MPILVKSVFIFYSKSSEESKFSEEKGKEDLNQEDNNKIIIKFPPNITNLEEKLNTKHNFCTRRQLNAIIITLILQNINYSAFSNLKELKNKQLREISNNLLKEIINEDIQ